jgi:hypothetical protein
MDGEVEDGFDPESGSDVFTNIDVDHWTRTMNISRESGSGIGGIQSGSPIHVH